MQKILELFTYSSAQGTDHTCAPSPARFDEQVACDAWHGNTFADVEVSHVVSDVCACLGAFSEYSRLPISWTMRADVYGPGFDVVVFDFSVHCRSRF